MPTYHDRNLFGVVRQDNRQRKEGWFRLAEQNTQFTSKDRRTFALLFVVAIFRRSGSFDPGTSGSDIGVDTLFSGHIGWR